MNLSELAKRYRSDATHFSERAGLYRSTEAKHIAHEYEEAGRMAFSLSVKLGLIHDLEEAERALPLSQQAGSE